MIDWKPIGELDEKTRYGDEAGFLLMAPELIDEDCNIHGVGMGYYQDERDVPSDENGAIRVEVVDYGGWLACKWSMTNDEWAHVPCTPTHYARITGLVGKTQEDYEKEAEGYEVLGPSYFATREAVEKFMAQFKAKHFAPLIKKASDEFYSVMHDKLESYLLSDTETNLHGTLWRQVDATLKAILDGKKWAVEKYLTGRDYDCGAIREAVARVVPRELQDARIADLEKEIEQLREQLKWHQRG